MKPCYMPRSILRRRRRLTLLKRTALLQRMLPLRPWTYTWPTRSTPRPLHKDADAIKVVQSFLLHNAVEPKGGDGNRPEDLDDQLREILADETRRTSKAVDRSSRP